MTDVTAPTAQRLVEGLEHARVGALPSTLAPELCRPLLRPERSDSFAVGGLCFLLCAFAPAAGCGYRFLDTQAPFGASSISVVPFSEAKAVGVSAELATSLSGLLAAGGMRVTTDTASAAAVLTGEVTTEHTSSSPWIDESGQSLAYRTTIGVRAQLVDRDGHVLWKTTVSESDYYRPPEGPGFARPVEIEVKRRVAMGRLASLIARRLYDSLIASGSFTSVEVGK